MNQKRQENMQLNQMMDKNQQLYGSYLEGDKPAVQEAWNMYQKALDATVESNSPAARRKANEAYGYYAQLAGAAQANSQMFQKQVAQYKADPSKFAVSGMEFLDKSDSYRLQKRTAEDIFGAVNNPFVLESKMTYDLSNPMDEATKMLSMSSAKLKDFYDDNGVLNKSALRAYARDLAQAKATANDMTIEKALAWGGVRQGYAGGPDGMITSMDELEFLRQQPEEKRNQFIESYVNELTDNYMKLVPSEIKVKEETGKAPKYSLTEYSEPLPEVGKPEDFKGQTMYALSNKLSGSMANVIAFGYKPTGELVVLEEEKVKDDKTGETSYEKTYRTLDPSQMARLEGTLKKDYNITLEKSVSSQEESGSNTMSDAEYQQWLKDNGLAD